jgi:hypothetical protein
MCDYHEPSRDDVMVVHKEQSNAALVEKLKSFREYILSDNEPEWKQLVAIGGFVADVIRLLKWSEKPVYPLENYHYYKNEHVMTCEDICDSLWQAIDYTFNEPYADELNAMWQDWYFHDTGKYDSVETIGDMTDIICDRIEERYPGILSMVRKYFYPEEEE